MHSPAARASYTMRNDTERYGALPELYGAVTERFGTVTKIDFAHH